MRNPDDTPPVAPPARARPAVARRRKRRWALRIVTALAAVLILFVVAAIVTARPGNEDLYPPAPDAPRVPVYVVSRGYHAGIVVPRTMLAELASRRGFGALINVATRFAGFNWLEIGWGDEEFYRNVPDAGALTLGLAVRALMRGGNHSVLHVVGLSSHPRIAFAHSDLVHLDLSEAGFERLAQRIDATFARDNAGVMPLDLGPGLYGASRFYRAVGSFSLLRVCNHWIADLLDAAGLPTAPLLATLPAGLFLDLRLRAGIERLPPLPH